MNKFILRQNQTIYVRNDIANNHTTYQFEERCFLWVTIESHFLVVGEFLALFFRVVNALKPASHDHVDTNGSNCFNALQNFVREIKGNKDFSQMFADTSISWSARWRGSDVEMTSSVVTVKGDTSKLIDRFSSKFHRNRTSIVDECC